MYNDRNSEMDDMEKIIDIMDSSGDYSMAEVYLFKLIAEDIKKKNQLILEQEEEINDLKERLIEITRGIYSLMEWRERRV